MKVIRDIKTDTQKTQTQTLNPAIEAKSNNFKDSILYQHVSMEDGYRQRAETISSNLEDTKFK